MGVTHEKDGDDSRVRLVCITDEPAEPPKNQSVLHVRRHLSRLVFRLMLWVVIADECECFLCCVYVREQLVTMASDTEDAPSSAALVSSIREKIVQHKEFLLRYVRLHRDDTDRLALCDRD